MLVVAFIITATYLNVRGVKRNDSFMPEVFYPIVPLTPVGTEDSCGLRWNGVAVRPFLLTG